MMLRTGLVPFVALSALAVAQDVAPAEGEPLPVVALPGEQGALVSAMRAFSQGLAVDGDARIWCLLQECVGDDRSLMLCRSDDVGATWTRVTEVPTAWSSYGALAGEPGSSILHVAWSARLEQEQFASAVYQRFDGAKGEWLGEPDVLQQGVGAEDQFGVSDLAIDREGRVAVLVSTHRRPKQPPWPSGWSTGLMLRAPQQANWQGPFPVHTSTYGVWANLQLHDGHAHTTYRTSPSHSIIGYRSFSLGAKTFDQPKDVEVSVRPQSGRYVSNASALLVGPFGDRTVLYPAAASAQDRKGQLMLAYSQDGVDWRTTALVDDPPMANGNVSHEHFAIARGPGRQAIALYSKVCEDYRVLYRRIVDGGEPMGDERVVARSDVAGAFQRIVAMRDERVTTGVWALVTGLGDAATLGVRAVRAPRPMRTRWQ